MTPNISLDWHTYFLTFSEMHGGDPVEHKSRLLFRDGWGYNRTDHRGPEYSPPTDPRELHQLQVAYWETRLRKVRNDYTQTDFEIKKYRELMSQRNAPLQAIFRFSEPDEQGQLRVREQKGPLDLEPLVERLAELVDLETDCAIELSRLNNDQVERFTPSSVHNTRSDQEPSMSVYDPSFLE
jgi:hypothetical protein